MHIMRLNLINFEMFRFIEKKGSVTPEDLASKFGIGVPSAKVWLSRWTTKGYLRWVFVHKTIGHPKGCYVVGEKEWFMYGKYE